MKKEPESTIYLMFRVLRNPHLWIVAIIMVFLILVHYHELFVGVNLLDRLSPVLGFGLTRNTVARILFLIPVVYGTAKLGIGAGISLLVLVAAAMFPRVFIISPASREALFETCAVIIVGALIVSLWYAWQKAARRLAELETTQRRLNSYIQKLSQLHAISSMINQSLDLNLVINSAIIKISQLLECPIVWLNLSDRDTGQLKLLASYGLSEAGEIHAAEFSPGPDAKAVQNLSPVVIEDTSIYHRRVVGAEAFRKQLRPVIIKELVLNPGSVSAALAHEEIQSLLVVPLISKGKAVGTLGIAFHDAHHYPQDEIDLLTAVADQFGMAIENARLFQKERLVAEELRRSEKNYRDIFENASDAIWVHDLKGKILAVNSALCRLTGYQDTALIGSDISKLSPEYGLTKASQESHDRALKGEPDQPYEQKIVKKDGSEVILQIGTSLTSRGEKSQAFQHIARDITEERRIQNNLRLYAQKISQAQETERKRIARELHDETVQALVVVSRHLYNLAHGKSNLTALDIQAEIQKISDGIRHYSQELRPSILDDLGLLPALQWLASDLTQNYGICAEVEIIGNRRPLTQEAELMLFRITQEALTNIRKHSKATRAFVKVNFFDHAVKVIIQDNGQGFEMPSRTDDLARSGKLGLAGMLERAQLLGGILNIDSQTGRGTTLSVEIPV